MFDSTVLEVAIGIVFVYLLLSLICSAAKEGLESILNRRATYLERGIKELLADPSGTGLVKELYKHPLIDSLFRGTYEEAKQTRVGSRLPSYIPPRNFALALLDILRRAPQRPDAGAPPPESPAARERPPAVAANGPRHAQREGGTGPAFLAGRGRRRPGARPEKRRGMV